MKIVNKALTSKRYLLVLILMCLMLLSTATFTYAWYNGVSFQLYGGTEDSRLIAELAVLKENVDVTGYKLDSYNTLVATPFYSDEEVEDDDSLTIQTGFINDKFEPGALNKLNLQASNYTTLYNNVIAENTSTRYFKVTNRSDINIAVKMLFEIESDSEDGLDDLTSFWYLITDVTNSVNNQTGSDDLTKLTTYAALNKSSRVTNNYNENNPNTNTFETATKDSQTSASKVELGEVAKMSNNEETVRYFRLDYGLCESVLRSSGINFHSKTISMKLHIYYGQVNAPEEGEEETHESIKDVYTAAEFYNYLDDAGLTYQGDTIRLMADITLDRDVNGSTDVTLSRALNINLNGHHLIIDGDFYITHESTTAITIDTSMQGQLEIRGQMRLTVPNGSVTLYGDNATAQGTSAYDISVYSSNSSSVGTGIYNGVGNNDNGLYLQNVYIVQKYLDSMNAEQVGELGIQLQEASYLKVASNVYVDNVTSGQITSTYISNYGKIGQINLISMVLPFTSVIHLKIYNNGTIYRDRNTYDVIIPTTSTPGNTQIIKGALSNDFSLNTSSSFKYSNITYEGAIQDYVTCISEIDQSYSVYLNSDVSSLDGSRIKYALLDSDYFKDNESLLASIRKLTITTTGDVFINEYDFTFLNGLAELTSLDLTNCNCETANYLTVDQRNYRIPDSAFSGKSTLSELILPSNIKYVGTNAFYGTSITSVTIPSSIITLGSGAFNSVTEASIESLYPITNNNNFLPAFTTNTYFFVNEARVDAYKDQFETYTAFPNVVNHVYEQAVKVDSRYVKFFTNRTCQIVAFVGDVSESDIAPSVIEYNGTSYSVIAIGRDAYINASNFYGNTLALLIGDNILSIGKNAFANLSMISSVSSLSVQYIDEEAFINNTGLITAVFSGELVVCEKAFSNCSNLRTITMANATQFKDSSFENCVSIRTLTIPNIEYIGSNVFSGCSSFVDVVLGKLTELSSNVFKNCRNLESIGLTSTTTIINSGAFEGCTSLNTIYIYDSNEKDGYAFLDYIVTIGDNAFKSCTSLNNVYAPSLTTIGEYAFYGCTNLEYFIANDVTSIGNYAFNGDLVLKLIEMEDVETIGEYAFVDTVIEYAIVPNATSIGKFAFRNVSTIKAVALGNINAIGENAFVGVYPYYVDLTSFNFNDSSITTLGGDEIWHSFKSTTRYYYDGTIDSANRKQRIYAIASNSYNYNSSYSLDINLVYPCTTFGGEMNVESNDYDDNLTITLKGVSQVQGYSKNLYLYGVEAVTNTIISYHGPNLSGNVVIPFKTSNDMEISDTDFEDRTTSYYDGTILFNGTFLSIYNIGERAFYGVNVTNSEVCKVSFGNTVNKIESEAFKKSYIDYAYFNNVTEICDSAFRNTSELAYVDLENVITIGDYAFSELLTGDVQLYYANYRNNPLTFTKGKLTKVIFRHVNTVGKGSFMKRINADDNFIILDLSENIPDANATDGFGPNDNINLPKNLNAYWLGFSNKYWLSYDWNNLDTYVLAPYYEDEYVAIKNAFELNIPSQYVVYDYGYVYHPEYSINGVEVGMYHLIPVYDGDIVLAFYIDKCFLRNLGTDDQVIEGYVNNGSQRSTFTINNYVNIASVYDYNNNDYMDPDDYEGTTIRVTLTEKCFKSVGAVSGKYCDLYTNQPTDSANDITAIPEYCFLYAGFTDYYLYGIKTIADNVFRYSPKLNNIYGYRLESIGAYITYYSYLSIIDLRENKQADGSKLICSFNKNIIYASYRIKNIYVSEDDYEDYVEGTKNIIAYNKYDNNLDTDIELYLYVTVPGVYVADLKLNYESSYNFSSLLSAYESADPSLNEHLYWESTDNNVKVIDGIISYTGTARNEVAYVKCYKTQTVEGVTTSKLLGYMKVTITLEDTEVEYYNLSLKTRTLANNTTITGYKVNDYYGTNLYGVFNPTARLNTFMTTVFTGSGFDLTSYDGVLNHKIDGEYKIFELGIGSYRSITATPGIGFYLYTDEYITEIDDYAFYQAPFYEVWLTNVSVLGRKSFLNGSSINNLVLVVMPNIEEIGDYAFNQNRTLKDVIIGDDNFSKLESVGQYAFSVCNELEHFGLIDVNLGNFTFTQYSSYIGDFDSLSAQFYKSQINTYFGEDDYRYVNHYYDSSDLFIYLPNSVESIGTYCFYECREIEIVRLPYNPSFTTISNYAFGLDTNLNVVHTYPYIVNVGNYAFYNCPNLGDPDFIDNTSDWGTYRTYMYNAPDDEKIYLESGIDFTYFETIGSNAFANCYELESISMSNIKSVGTAAFFECKNLRYIDFTNCTPDKNVTFGGNWNTNNHALSRYYVASAYQKYFKAIPNTYVKDIEYNDGEYYLSYVKDAYGSIIGVKIVCYNGENMVQIPSTFNINGTDYNVVTIGKYAYKGYKSSPILTTVYLPNTVSTIEDYAFADCYFNYYEELPTTSTLQTTYGDYVFANNEKLISCKFVRMDSAGDFEFENCTDFEIVNLADNYKRYSALSNVYYAPVIGDNYFTNSPGKAHCVIKTGTSSMFTLPGYQGRVFEDSVQAGNYWIKVNDDSTATIVRYQGDNLSTESSANTSTMTYTIPLSLTDNFNNTYLISAVGGGAFSSATIPSGWKLLITSNITSVGQLAFNYTAFKYVEIEGDVTLGDNAFSNMTNLISIDMDNVSSLTAEGLFLNDSQLTSVTFNSSITTVPAETFSGCTNIEEIKVSSSLTSVGDYAFYNCSSLKQLYNYNESSYQVGTAYLPITTTSIGTYAFYGCSGLTRINALGLTSVGSYAFADSTGITGMTIGSSSSYRNLTVGTHAFEGLTSLEQFSVQFSAIPSYCFFGCSSLNVITIPYVTTIGDYAFNACTSLTSIDFTSVETIGDCAFYGCIALSSINFRNVSYLGSSAFYGCTALTNLDLKNVNTLSANCFASSGLSGELDLKNAGIIGTKAFANCIGLTKVTFNKVFSFGSQVFQNDNNLVTLDFNNNKILSGSNYVLGVPTTVTSDSLGGMEYSDSFIIYAPGSLVDSYRSKFYNQARYIYELGTISTTNNLYMIKDVTRYNTTGVEIIKYLGTSLSSTYTVPTTLDGKTVISIGSYAFYNAYDEDIDTTTLNLGTGVLYVGAYAFYKFQFETVAMPSVKYVGDYAFYNNKAITHLSLPECIEIGYYAFANNTSLQIVRLYEPINKISNYAFLYDYDVSCFYIGKSTTANISTFVSNLGTRAFGLIDESDLLIRVPNAVLATYKSLCNSYSNLNYYKDRIFAGEIDDADFSYRINNGYAEILAYEGQAVSITVPTTIAGYTVTKILDEAFKNSLNLTTITIPASLESISSHAFLGAVNLTTINVTGYGKFVSYDGILYMKSSSTGYVETIVAYPQARTNQYYDFTSSGHDLSHLNTVYENAFYGNTYIEYIIIPSNIMYIGENAFASCPSLTSVTFTAPSSGTQVCPTLYGTNVFTSCNSNLKIYVYNYNLFANDTYFSYYKSRIFLI